MDPHKHEIACASKSRLIDEVNTSFKYQLILYIAEKKHMSEILELFIAIKYPPKKYKWIVILGDGVNKSKVHGIGSITVEIQKKLSYTMSYISWTLPTPFTPSSITVVNLIAHLWSILDPLQ